MILKISNFSYTPPRQSAPLLSDLNIEIEEGEHVILIGQNGVGKTTLLRCIDLIITDWTGEISLHGTPLRKIPRKKLARKIAFVQQNPETPPNITVRQFTASGRYPYLAPFSPISRRDEEVIDYALRLTNTAELAGRNLQVLSGGERQRVWMAAALAQEPEICLLDEPSAFLDYRRRAEMHRLLDHIRTETGMALIEISHDLNRAVLSNARILALADGRIIYDGKKDGIMNPEILRMVYGVNFHLVSDPATGNQFVF